MAGRFLKEPRIDGGAKSIGIPAGNTAKRPEAPKFGSFRYNTDVGKLEYYNGTTFKQVALDGEKTLTIDTLPATTQQRHSHYQQHRRGQDRSSCSSVVCIRNQTHTTHWPRTI